MEPGELVNHPQNDYSEIVEGWADVMEISVTDYSVTFRLGRRATKPDEPNRFTHSFMVPLPLAKVLGILTLRQIRAYEARFGIEVQLPRILLDSMGIPPEDWRTLR